MPKLLTALLLACAALAAGCGGDDDDKAGDGGTTTATATASGCRDVDAPGPREDGGLKKPTKQLDDAKEWEAVVKTSCGEFTIALDVKRARKTASSFAHMAREKFFDGLTFHRIIAGFVIQGGDPTGQGTGGPGYSVVEAPPEDLKYTRGVVAMAKTELEDSGTSGSQFFIVTGEDAELPADYALVGEIAGGQDVVDRIGAVETDPQDRPVEPVVIESVTIRES